MTFQISGRVTVKGRGRPGVCVSNGEAVARTDRSGAYRLRVDPSRHRFVFVVTPDDARPAGDFYRSTEGWNGRQEQIDFALGPAPERRRRTFAFAQLTDLHVALDKGRYYDPPALRAGVRRALSGWDPAFVVATGDLTDRGDIPSLKAYRKILAAAPCSVFHMFGGHDGLAENRAPGYEKGDPCTRHYESVLGPAYYSFDWGGRHFVVFPNEDHFFAPSEAQAKDRWLTADLRAHAGRETVLFIHVPPSRAFLDRLARTDVAAVFFGHWHSSKAYTYRGICVFATPCFPFGGIDTAPRCYRRVAFQGGRMRTELVPVLRSRPPVCPEVPQPQPARCRERPLRLLWHTQLDTEMHRAAPVVEGDRILMALGDEDGKGRQGVLCLDLNTGRPRWRLRSDASIKNAVVVSGDLAAAVSVTGRIVAFDPGTGTERWRIDLPGYPDRWIYTSPAVADGIVYAGGKAGYGAYDLKTGGEIWYTRPSDSSDAWSCFAGPTVVGDIVVLLVQRRGIVGLDRASGQEVWRRELAVEYMYPKPVVAAGRVFTGGQLGEVAALDAATGAIVWSQKVTDERHISGLGADETAVYVATPTGEVRACSMEGKIRWRFEVGQELLDMTPYRRAVRTATGGPTPMGDRVAVGAGDGHLYLLERRTGTLVDRWWFGSPISASPAVGGDRLVVGSFDGLVGCFEVG